MSRPAGTVVCAGSAAGAEAGRLADLAPDRRGPSTHPLGLTGCRLFPHWRVSESYSQLDRQRPCVPTRPAKAGAAAGGRQQPESSRERSRGASVHRTPMS